MKKVIKVMDSTGDSRVEFETDDAASIMSKSESEARALFDRLTAKASAVFAVNRGEGMPDKRVTNFNDLEAENIIVPAIIGG